MPFETYGAPQFGLADLKIAAWTATDTYGTAADIMSAQLYGAVLQIISAQLEGDDQITATASRAIGAEARMRFGGVSIAAYEILLGNTATSSVASPNEVTQLKMSGGDNMPYIGICGKAIAEEGTGDFLVFMPKVRITSDVGLATLEYGSFTIPEMTLQAVNDVTYGILSIIRRETAAVITIPPANIV